MPLPDDMRATIAAYCVRDLPGDLEWHCEQFDFILDPELRKRLGRAFYAARYTGKLMEGLKADGDTLHVFVKFQVIQYASIYEAVITYMLWTRLPQHPEVISVSTHKAYKPVNALGSTTKMTYGNEDLFTCVYRDARTPKTSISFGDKVDCAIRIGLLDARYANDIKQLFTLRNLTHIETEASKNIEIELKDSKQGYWRMQPFLNGVRGFVADGSSEWLT